MSKTLIVIMSILSIRGILGIVQDCNYWYDREFNLEGLKGWLKEFKR